MQHQTGRLLQLQRRVESSIEGGKTLGGLDDRWVGRQLGWRHEAKEARKLCRAIGSRSEEDRRLAFVRRGQWPVNGD